MGWGWGGNRQKSRAFRTQQQCYERSLARLIARLSLRYDLSIGHFQAIRWQFMKTESQTPVIGLTTGTNWWGLCSTIGLFAWVSFWLKREPGTVAEGVLCWTTFVAIHLFAIKAARRRYGWFYFAPIGLFWILVIIGLSGGIPH